MHTTGGREKKKMLNESERAYLNAAPACFSQLQSPN